MKEIFEQIEPNAVIDDKKNHVIIKFPVLKLEYKFNTVRRSIEVLHKSHAVIAAVTGRTIRCKGEEIRATNKIFDWLGITYTVSFETVEKAPEALTADGIISYF